MLGKKRQRERPHNGLTTIENAFLVGAIALCISVVFSFANQFQYVALQHMDVRNGTLILVTVGFLVILLLSPFYLEPATLLTPPVLWFALAGLIVPSLSMTLHTMSVQMLGPAISSALTSTSPVFAIAIAIGFLSETADLQLYAGTAIIIGGIAFIGLRSRKMRANWPLWALVIPLGAALGRAVSHNVIKFGLNDLPNPMTAALVGSFVSTLVLLSWHKVSGRTMPAFNAGYYWFALCGLLNAIGLIGLNVALQLGSVTTVAPLISTTPVFTLILGWLIFKRETIGLPTVCAICAIFAGCLLIIVR
jgi:drug/metabolite transporter (DMT)-like permease